MVPLFLRLPLIPAQLSDSVNAYDFNTSILYLRDEVHPFDMSEVAVHEVTHWFQHHGTSAGCFLSLLKEIRDRFGIACLAQLTSSRLEKLLQDRSNGIPIIDFDATTFTPDLRDEWHGPNLLPAKETWYRLFLSELTMSRYSEVPSHLGNPGYAVAIASMMAQETLFNQGVPGISSLNTGSYLAFIDRMERTFAPTILPISEETEHPEPLDTCNLMETSSMLVEAQLILGAYEPRDEKLKHADEAIQTKRNERTKGDAIGCVLVDTAVDMISRGAKNMVLMDRKQALRELAVFGRFGLDRDPYNLAIHFAARTLGDDATAAMHLSEPDAPHLSLIMRPFVVRYLPTIAAAIEIALNPPLPPRHNLDLKVLDWTQVYPPARYEACIKAIRRVGPILDQNAVSATAMRAYQQELADAANIIFLPVPGANVYAAPEAKLTQVSRLFSNPPLDIAEIKNIDYHDIVRYFQSQFSSAQRSMTCGAVTDLMRRIETSLEKDPLVYDAVKFFGDEHSGIPPVGFVTKEGKTMLTRRPDISRQSADWLLFFAARNYCSYDLIVGTGMPDFQPFHLNEDQTKFLTDFTAKAIARTIGVRPW